MTSSPTEQLKRGPGRPRGLGKVPGSGRKPGTPNRSTVQTRDRIQELADPIAFLADVMAGKQMVAAGEPGDAKKTWCYPTLTQRIQASETLLRKLLPDLRATELTGDLRPAFTRIERVIVDRAAQAIKAGNAVHEVSNVEDTAKSNGVVPIRRDGSEYRPRKRE